MSETPTLIPAEELTGPALAQAVAVEVMDGVPSPGFAGLWTCRRLSYAAHPAFFLGWAGVGYVVDELRAQGWEINLSANDFEGEPWDCRFFLMDKRVGAPRFRAIAHGATAPLAICRAALEAVRAQAGGAL